MRKKLIRFNENASNHLIIEPEKPFFGKTKGKWAAVFAKGNPVPVSSVLGRLLAKFRQFMSRNPVPGNRVPDLILEFGCGRGEYTIGLAQQFPEKNYLGLDLKGERLWYGANDAIDLGLDNVRFLRLRGERIEDHIGVGEVAEIWLPFPGPRPKKGEANRRLTNSVFLERYKRLLKPGGLVRLKTDSKFAYSYTLEVLGGRDDIEIMAQTDDLYNSPYLDDHHGVQTHFEKKFLAEGKKIHYLKWRFRA